MGKKITKVTLLTLLMIFIISGIIIVTNSVKLIEFKGEKKVHNKVTDQSIRDLFNNSTLTLKDEDTEYIYTYKEVGIQAKLSEEQIKNIKKSLFVNVDKMSIDFELGKSLEDALDDLNKTRVDNKYAEFIMEDGEFKIEEEIHGNMIDVDKTIDNLKGNIKNNGTQSNLVIKEFDYTLPSSEEFQCELDRLNDFKISYTNSFELTGEHIKEYLTLENNKIVFNNDKEKDFIKNIDKLIEKELLSYDTVGGTWKFNTHNGEMIDVKGGTWGDYFNSDKETLYILEKVKLLESEENREPIKSQDLADSIPNTYVEVSITEQHLWFYKDGELVMNSPVVTGTKGKHDTPKGVYFISEKVNGKNLRGADYVTWVNKWMRITNRGHGLHDAYWRKAGTFGGNTYKSNGSHGCINLPKSFAYKLYYVVNVKDCVVIY